jgi:hypothetical protein
MTHKVTIEFEVDASNFDYPDDNRLMSEILQEDMEDNLETVVILMEQTDYKVKVEEL